MPDTTKHTIGRWINEELDRALEQNTPSPETRQAIIEQTTPPAMQQIPGVDYKQTGRWINEELDRHLAQIAPEEPAKQKSDQEQRGFFAEAGSAVGQGFVTTGESIVSLGEMLRVPGMKSTAEYLRKLRDHEMLRRPDYLAEGDILEKPERLADWRWWVRSLGENIPNLLAVYAGVGGAAKAAQVLNWGQKAIRTTAFAAGFGGSFSIEAGAQYSQAKQEMQRTGLLEDDAIERIATAEGLIAGTVNAILEVIPADNLIFRNKDAKKLLSKIVRQGLWEGGTEMVQEGVNVLVSQHGHAPDQKLSAELGRIIEAGLTGLVLGGGAAAVHAPFESAGASPAPSEQGAAPSAKPHTDMPIVPSNEASKTHVTEGQRQTTLDEKHAADVQKHAANLYDTITAEVAAENEELEAARAAEIARREAETAAQAAQEQAEIDAAVTDAREQQATLKTTLAADNPQKQTIVDDVLSLTEKRLITALQKEMGLTITPAGPNLYSLETPAGPAPANLFDLRQRLAQHRITALDAKIAKQQADEKALAEAEERRAARKAQKDAESTLRHVRHLLNINSMLSASHISTLEQNYEQLTDTEKSKLNQAKQKEYTEMSLDEYIFRTTDGTPAAIPEAKRRHRELIIQARAAGKPVSPAALKDHPDLQETAQDKDILDEQENPDYQPAPVPASDNINTAALVTQMLTDLENSGQAGLVYDPATNSNKRISAGVAWLTAANKAGVKVDRAEARAILKKVQNKDTLTPRQETIFNAISSAARKHGGDYLEEATAWAEKGFTPLAGRKINIDDLTFGDRLVIAGEEFRVTDIDDAGNVTMKDGTIRKVRQGSTINDVDYFRPNPEAASFDMEQITEPKTQKDIVKQSLQTGPKSIKEIAEETKILEPNVRRILGMGTKEGVFERVDKGVYVLSKDGQDIAFIQTADAVDTLPKLAQSGFKADMIFLDIPYKTPAVTGGNRGIKYDYITPEEFKKVVTPLSIIARTEETPLIYMYSQARSGEKEMQKYTDVLLAAGFKPIARGEYTKLQKDGITRVRNMRGDVIEPEGIILFTYSGKFTKQIKDLNFKLIRPRGYQTEKPAAMLKALIEMSTEEGDIVLDPFAGSGVTGEQAVLTGRKAYLIEKSAEAVEGHIKPKIKQAAPGKNRRRAGESRRDFGRSRDKRTVGNDAGRVYFRRTKRF